MRGVGCGGGEAWRWWDERVGVLWGWDEIQKKYISLIIRIN